MGGAAAFDFDLARGVGFDVDVTATGEPGACGAAPNAQRQTQTRRSETEG
jgi:hypothetical protein